MRPVCLVPPRVWKQCNELVDVVKSEKLRQKKSNAQCKLNRNYPFKKIMDNVWRITTNDIEVRDFGLKHKVF